MRATGRGKRALEDKHATTMWRVQHIASPLEWERRLERGARVRQAQSMVLRPLPEEQCMQYKATGSGPRLCNSRNSLSSRPLTHATAQASSRTEGAQPRSNEAATSTCGSGWKPGSSIHPAKLSPRRQQPVRSPKSYFLLERTQYSHYFRSGLLLVLTAAGQ